MRKIKFRIPASSANIGPGFDTIGLALKLYCKLTVERSTDRADQNLKIELGGKYGAKLPADESNLIYKVIDWILPDGEKPACGLKLSIDTDVPLARGLGSSAGAVAIAVAAARWLSGENELNRDEIIQKAADFEGYADGLAASVLGGFVCVVRRPDARYSYASVDWPSHWSTILVVPDYEVMTVDARNVLPGSYSRPAAIGNVQYMATMMAAIQQADGELLGYSLRDNIHEPYRSQLVPELTTLRSHLRHTAAHGVVLSGAGSTILVIADESDKKDVVASIEQWKKKQDSGVRIMDLDVDRQGLVILDD